MPSLLIFLIVLVARAGSQPPQDPRALVRQATLAVEGDSAARLAERWAARRRADSTDRAATLGLATLARLGYDYPAADRLYRLLAATTPPDRFAVHALLGAAEALAARGRVRESALGFGRAIEAARQVGDRLAEAEALLHLTFMRGRLQGVAVAAATLDSATRLLPDTAYALLAFAADRRAILASLRGSDQAQRIAEESIELARRAADRRVEADAMVTLGKVIQYRGEPDSALPIFRRADSLYLAARSRSALAGSLIWQAQMLAARARFGEMREVMRRALREGEATGNLGAVGDAYRAFGVIGIMMGDFPDAAANLNRALAIATEAGDSSSIRLTLKFLADVRLAAGDVAEARRIVGELIARETENREAFELRSKLIAIAVRERDWAAADRAVAEARIRAERLPGIAGRWWLLHDEARLAQARGDLPRAVKLIGETLAGAQGPNDDQFRADLHARLADIAVRRGDLAAAEAAMTTASDEIDHWRRRLGDAELRVLAFQSTPMQHAASSELAERDARIARVLGALAAGGRAEAAFRLAERRRARELADRLARAVSLRIADARVQPVSARDSTSITGEQVARALPDERTALVELVGGTREAPLTAFVIRRSGLTAVALRPTEPLEESVARFVDLLEEGARPDALARVLGAELLDPVLAIVGPEVTRLVVVPDGPLHYLPWDALRLADGRYLVERATVSVAPSAAVATALWRREPRAAAPARLLALGDPAFASAGRADGRTGEAESGTELAAAEYRAAFDSSGGLPRLEGSAEEARMVGRYADRSLVRLRGRASAAFLKRTPLDSFRVIHLATHALVDDRTVVGTALALAPGDGENGFVGVGDLAALRLDADLVVLSACRTGRGKLVGGEGLQGLTAALFEAGARSVVATQWRVGDRRTVPFVRDFYRELANGQPVSEALRAAKLAAVRSGSAPDLWAAFTTVGDPFVVVPVRPPAPRRWPVAIGAGMLVIAIAVLARRRRTAR